MRDKILRSERNNRDFTNYRKMEDEFTCPICLDVAKDAMETSCCHHIYCQGCIEGAGVNNCPQCRSPFTTSPAYFARRVIGNMKVKCEFGCGLTLSRSDVDKHALSCSMRIFQCPATACQFSDIKDRFWDHLASTHKDKILNNFHKCLVENVSEQEEQEEQVGVKDRIATRRNSKGSVARLGETGKYYCGGSLESRCSCCNGRCGPINGCNCEACMALDVQVRRLPRNWYVNREGFAARRSESHFYCGRLVMRNDRRTDGYCGPTNGPNCDACRILEEQVRYRYTSVW